MPGEVTGVEGEEVGGEVKVGEVVGGSMSSRGMNLLSVGI